MHYCPPITAYVFVILSSRSGGARRERFNFQPVLKLSNSSSEQEMGSEKDGVVGWRAGAGGGVGGNANDSTSLERGTLDILGSILAMNMQSMY